MITLRDLTQECRINLDITVRLQLNVCQDFCCTFRFLLYYMYKALVVCHDISRMHCISDLIRQFVFIPRNIVVLICI